MQFSLYFRHTTVKLGIIRTTQRSSDHTPEKFDCFSSFQMKILQTVHQENIPNDKKSGTCWKHYFRSKPVIIQIPYNLYKYSRIQIPENPSFSSEPALVTALAEPHLKGCHDYVIYNGCRNCLPAINSHDMGPGSSANFERNFHMHDTWFNMDEHA